MEEKEMIQNEKLKDVAGGIEPVFINGKVICPVCGEPSIKLIASDEFTDTYQCGLCGKTSIHTKKERVEEKIHPNLQCPRCGMSSWQLVSSANGVDYLKCTVCRLDLAAQSDL